MRQLSDPTWFGYVIKIRPDIRDLQPEPVSGARV